MHEQTVTNNFKEKLTLWIYSPYFQKRELRDGRSPVVLVKRLVNAFQASCLDFADNTPFQHSFPTCYPIMDGKKSSLFCAMKLSDNRRFNRIC